MAVVYGVYGVSTRGFQKPVKQFEHYGRCFSNLQSIVQMSSTVPFGVGGAGLSWR